MTVQFLVGAVVFGALMGLQWMRMQRIRFLRRDGARTVGSVVEVVTTRAGAMASTVKQESVVEFVAPDHGAMRFKTRGAMAGEVSVVFDPSRPKRAEVAGNLKLTREWFGLSIFGLFFVGFLVAAFAGA